MSKVFVHITSQAPQAIVLYSVCTQTSNMFLAFPKNLRDVEQIVNNFMERQDQKKSSQQGRCSP